MDAADIFNRYRDFHLTGLPEEPDEPQPCAPARAYEEWIKDVMAQTLTSPAPTLEEVLRCKLYITDRLINYLGVVSKHHRFWSERNGSHVCLVTMWKKYYEKLSGIQNLLQPPPLIPPPPPPALPAPVVVKEPERIEVEWTEVIRREP